MTGSEADAAAQLLERLLTDRTFRSRFRSDPAAASREAGLESVAEEMELSAGKAMDTLDERESRSSLAGVLMAAALEGVGVAEFSNNFLPHLADIPHSVGDVLSRVQLPAVAEAQAATPRAGGGASHVAGEFRAITPEQVAAARSAPGHAAVLDAVQQSSGGAAAPEDGAGGAAPEDVAAGSAPVLSDPPSPPESPEHAAIAEAAGAGEGGDDDGGDEPGGLEDPGGDTDAEADDESDGGDAGDNDSISDDPSDEQEDDEESDEDESDEDDGGDGDHDDNSDGTPGSGGETETDDGGGGDASFDLGDAGDYPGDDASQPQIAAWMGSEAEKRGVPAELPVMAALVESNMSNVDHGDADSVGYFQMRQGIWNKGAYAGYPDQAELQLKWFLDQAAAVKSRRVAAGQPVDDPRSYGDWIADVERPAAEYRGRYQLRLEEAQNLLRQGAENRQGGGGGDADLDPLLDGAGSSAGPRALAAVSEARRYLGTPYKWGGSTPQTGFDCSGLVQWAYAKAGIRIPRTSEQQILASNGTPVDRAHLRAGDLVFFRNSGGDVHHVGISLGGDRFINAPHTGDVVKVASLKESYYAGEFAGGRRFDRAGSGVARAAAAAVGGEGSAGGVAPGVDPNAAREAEAALARDAAEVQRPGTLLFEAVRAQEALKAAEPRF